MSITASNYVVSYRTPVAPRIGVNLNTASGEEVASAVSAYTVAATEYADGYTAIVSDKAYAEDRLMKDLCASVDALTDGGVDLEHNTVALHEKADEVFGYAKGNLSLATVANISAIEGAFNGFYGTYYMDDAGESSILAGAFGEAVTYDSRAVTVSADIGASVESGSVFILDVPVAAGNARTYTNYSGSDAKFGMSYSVSYVVDSSVTGAWVLTDKTADDTVVAYSLTSPADGATWVAVGE